MNSNSLLIDETFNIYNSQNYNIILQLLPDCFSYTIYDIVRNKFVLLKNSFYKNEDELNHLIESDEYLKATYESNKLYFFAKDTIIIPLPFSENQNNSKYLSFNVGENNKQVLSSLSPFDTVLNFYVDLKIINYFRSSEIISHSYSILKLAEKECLRKQNISGLFLYVLKNYFEVVVITNDKLQLFNIYNFKTSDDFSYYINYLFDLFKFNNEKTFVKIFGIISKDDYVIQNVKKYIKNIEFINSNSKHIYSYRFKEIPQYYFSNLFV